MSPGNKLNVAKPSRWSALLDWIYPRSCVRCGGLLPPAADGYCCADCRRRYFLVEGAVCAACGIPLGTEAAGVDGCCPQCRADLPELAPVRSLLRYRGTGARLVQALKYEGGLYLRAEIERLLRDHAEWRAYFLGKVVVPVPLHPAKLGRRGYNQAEVIAQALVRAGFGVGVEPVLRRTRMTPSQTQLHREERLQNVRGAFHCPRSLDRRIRWVLVDDVLTTGATLEASAEALRAAGAEGISAFTLARG